MTFRARSLRGRCVVAPGPEEHRPFISGVLPGLRFLLKEAAWLSGSSYLLGLGPDKLIHSGSV